MDRRLIYTYGIKGVSGFDGGRYARVSTGAKSYGSKEVRLEYGLIGYKFCLEGFFIRFTSRDGHIFRLRELDERFQTGKSPYNCLSFHNFELYVAAFENNAGDLDRFFDVNIYSVTYAQVITRRYMCGDSIRT